MVLYMPKALRDIPKPKRKSAKQQVRECRRDTINEAIEKLKYEMRSRPAEWHRGYNSAITQLEIMRDEKIS